MRRRHACGHDDVARGSNGATGVDRGRRKELHQWMRIKRLYEQKGMDGGHVGSCPLDGGV